VSARGATGEVVDQFSPLAEELAARLPSGWEIKSLGALCGKPQYGWTSKANREGHGVKFLRTTDITPGFVDWSTVPYCSEEPDELEKYLIRDGDLLISRAGSVGVSHLVSNPEAAVFASYLIRFRPKVGVSAKYLRYYLQSPMYWRAIGIGKLGIAVQNVNATTLSQIPVSVAPEPVQLEIVAEIEKQFSRLDEGVANLKRVKVNLTCYKAAVLKTAVEGRLVETEGELARREGRSYETGAQLLQRILEMRRRMWTGRGKYKELVAPLPPEGVALPDGWTWATVESLSTKVSDGVHKKPNYVPDGVPFVTVKNLTAGSGISFEELNFVSNEDHIEFCKRTNPERGDILISKDGTLGVVRVIDTDRPFSIFVSVALVKPVLRELSRYLAVALESPILQRQMVPKGSGLQHIHLEDLRADCVPLPPIAEQHRIVAEVERRFSLIREIENEVEVNLQRSQSLRRTVLRTRFGW